MYPSLPFTAPLSVWSWRLCALAMPKSITLRWPVCETMRFDGEMSRWTMLSCVPCSSTNVCAYSSASHISPRIDSTTCSGMGSLERFAKRSSLRTSKPATSSIAM